MYKLSLVLLSIVIGYHLDRALFSLFIYW
ncbi:putative holin [Gilliamella apicola]